jgi:hypothetical protein
MDDERLRDDLAGWACYRVDRLLPGYRMIHLYDSNGILTQGIIWVRIARKWTPNRDKGDSIAAAASATVEKVSEKLSEGLQKVSLST